MSQHFDVCVLGSGAVGQSVAYAARRAGKTAVLIESHTPGGTCPNRGCDAKKPYVNAASLAYRVNRLSAAEGGIATTAIRWNEIAAFKTSFTNPVGPNTARDVIEAGIHLIEAPAQFVDESTVTAGDERVTADQIVIATGQTPRTLAFDGAEHTVNSDELLELKDLPDRVGFIGGGYIGMEFACAAAATGRDVTVVTSGDHTLDAFDPFVVSVMEDALPGLGAHGVNVIRNARIRSVRKTSDGSFQLYSEAGADTAVATVDLVVNSSGRVPAVQELNLDAAGVTSGPAGVHVDEYLRCVGKQHIWAGGDVAANGRPGLIPTAVDDARVLKHNLFSVSRESDLRRRADGPICSVAFSTPAVASAGLTEAAAREKYGDTIFVTHGEMNGKKFFRELGQTHVAYKLVFHGRNLVGAHLTAEGADEVINLLGLALNVDGRSHTLYTTTLTYPSISSALQGVFRRAIDEIG